MKHIDELTDILIAYFLTKTQEDRRNTCRQAEW